MNVLIADDDPISRKLLEKMVGRSGFEVTCVDDGESAAAQLLATDGPRLAILDWMMPGRDGPTICRDVRASVDSPYVYLILLTSRETVADVVMGLEAGADDYLTKPFNPDELKARLRAGERILQLQDSLLYEAMHDSLTGLPNRAYFVKRLSESVRKTQEHPGYQFTLLFVDIDRFKLINDSLGHMAGDELIKCIGWRLQQSVRLTSRKSDGDGKVIVTQHDLVARNGGDEFVILLDNCANTENGVRVAKRIQEELSSPFSIGGREIFVTASIGISISRGETDDASQILRGADAAMYQAKLMGKARYVIDQSSGVTKTDPFRLENDLRRGIQRGELELHYQPIVDLQNGKIVSLEALVRWRHPELGLVPPNDFIPLAEETGLILPLGAWVMREACRQMQNWMTLLDPNAPMVVCVNVSPRQFREANLSQQVKEVLLETGLTFSRLELEVTENLTIHDAERATRMLQDLRELGVSLSLDDFGTGYSSLSYLLRFPMRTLKIDRSFIAEIGSSNESRDIVQTIIVLGHNLGMKVIAEGVETEEQRDLLRNLGCDLGQGYFFSPAVEPDKAAALLVDGQEGALLGTRDAATDGRIGVTRNRPVPAIAARVRKWERTSLV
jgi:diguanylate cyclase (GGDEF)-like protein